MKFDLLNKTDWRVFEEFIQNPGYQIIEVETHQISPIFMPNSGDDGDGATATEHQILKIVTYKDCIIPKRKLLKNEPK